MCIRFLKNILVQIKCTLTLERAVKGLSELKGDPDRPTGATHTQTQSLTQLYKLSKSPKIGFTARMMFLLRTKICLLQIELY